MIIHARQQTTTTAASRSEKFKPLPQGGARGGLLGFFTLRPTALGEWQGL